MDTRVVIISDGKRGHENQSRVVARILDDANPLVMLLRDGGITEAMLRLRLRGKGAAAIPQAKAARLVKRYLQPEQPGNFREFAAGAEEHRARGRLFTVSTGTPPATFNLVMAALLRCPPIVNMTPSLLPLQLFGLCIVPAHDVHPGVYLPPNVVVSPLALGHHDAAAAQLMAGQLSRDAGLAAGEEYWGVAIGGPSKSCPWHGDRVTDELAALHGLARGEKIRLLVTTSRRTPEYCLNWLRRHYVDSDRVAYFLDASQDPSNPLPAFYELSRRMFVTGDSFSMLSEAIHAGHRPVVLETAPALPGGKLGRALRSLDEAGLAVLGETGSHLPQRVALQPAGRQAANEYYGQLRAEVRGRLGLDG